MTTIEKAQASYLGPSEPTPGRQPTRSSSYSRGSSSDHRQGQLALGLRHLVASLGYGKRESKATVSTHPKYSARLTSDLF